MASHHLRIAIGVLASAVGGLMGIAPAHAQSRAVADCHGIESSAERLACYDAASGRQAAAKAVAPAAPSGPAAAPTPPAAPVPAIAESAPRAGESIIDAMWGFDPSSERYAIQFYQPNYLLFGRYTNDANVGPYLPLFEAAGDPSG